MLEHLPTDAAQAIVKSYNALEAANPKTPAAHRLRQPLIRVAINPGHGGLDGGAPGSPDNERDFVWRLGKDLADCAIKMGWEPPLIHQNGDWEQLPYTLNALKPDIILSLHLNSAGPTATGTECWYLGPVGKQLAQEVQKTLVDVLGLPDRGVKYIQDDNMARIFYDAQGRKRHYGDWIFLATDAPVVLIEFAFLSNLYDMRTLRDRYDELLVALVDCIYVRLPSLLANS